jgi:hypothetical protein
MSISNEVTAFPGGKAGRNPGQVTPPNNAAPARVVTVVAPNGTEAPRRCPRCSGFVRSAGPALALCCACGQEFERPGDKNIQAKIDVALRSRQLDLYATGRGRA